ncbi:MAG: hypothetical protein AAGL49_14735 [Pseudomonadota bacterium]
MRPPRLLHHANVMEADMDIFTVLSTILVTVTVGSAGLGVSGFFVLRQA